jgi:hypothetical protein
MPYVELDEDGAVKGFYAKPQPGYAETWVEPEDALARLCPALSGLGLAEVTLGFPPEPAAEEIAPSYDITDMAPPEANS